MDTKQIHTEGMLWFKHDIAPRLMRDYEIKYSSASKGDLGALEAVEFNSEKRGGYIHFWSNGYIGFQLVDYDSGDEIVEDVIVEWDDSCKNFDEVLAPLLQGLHF